MKHDQGKERAALRSKQAMAMQHVTEMLHQLEDAGRNKNKLSALRRLFPPANETTIVGMVYVRHFLIALCTELAIKGLIEDESGHEEAVPKTHDLVELWKRLRPDTRRQASFEYFCQARKEREVEVMRNNVEVILVKIERHIGRLLNENRGRFVEMRYLDDPKNSNSRFPEQQLVVCSLLTIAEKRGLLRQAC